MSEAGPEYAAGEPQEEPLAQPARRLTPTEGADTLTLYLLRRRELLIIELREVDRLLKRPQTVPERGR